MLHALRILLSVLIQIVFLCMPAIAQYPNFSFQHYTMKEGLSDNYIRNLYQDNRGYLWINTNEGLNRFDGFHFRRFFQNEKDSNAIASNISDRCIQMNSDQLLIHTFPVMSVFNLTTQQFRFQNSSLPGNTLSVSEDTGGRLWLGYADKIILADSLQTVIRSMPMNPDENLSPVNIHRLTNGKLALITMTGIFDMEETSGKISPLPGFEKDKSNEFYFSYSFYHPASNTLYAGGWTSGLYKVNLGTNQITNLRDKNKSSLFPNPVNAVLKDSRGRLWIGTVNGLLLYDEATRKEIWIRKSNENDGITDNHVRCIFEDRDKNIWIGTVDGLNKLSEGAQRISFFSREFQVAGQKAELYDIARLSNGDIIIATYGNGLFRFNETTRSIARLPQPFMTHTWMAEEIDGELYVGGHQQLIKADLKSYRFVPTRFLLPYYKNTDLVLIAYRDRAGDTWYSMNGSRGLLRKKAEAPDLIQYNNGQNPKPFVNSYFNTRAEDEKGNIWWGVNKNSELVKWNRETESFETIELSGLFNRPSKIRRGINCLFYENGHLWIGTDGAGLYELDTRNLKIREFTINEGIIGENVTQVVGDSRNRLWIGTRKGLSCLLPDRETFVSFSEADGLPEIAFNDGVCLYDSSKDQLYMGTQYSLLQFKPDDLLSLRSLPADIFIDEVLINGIKNTALLKNPVQLNFDQNNIQVNFSVIEYNNPASILVEYKLDGLNEKWEKAGQQRSINFLNLNDGNYTLQFRVKNPGSTDWRQLALPVQFTITPPFWETWWFRSILFITISGLLVVVLRFYYRRKIEHHKMLLEKQRAIEQERSRIAADMHDDLGAGVTRIKFLAEDIEDHLPAGIDKEELNKLKNSANEVVDKMSEIIWAMNEKNNSLEDLVFYIRSYSVHYLQENRINCTFKMPSEIPSSMISGEARRNIFLTVKECLHNIVKHAGAEKVTIEIEFNHGLRIVITDDGKGFTTPDDLRSGNGILNMKKRISDLNGTIDIKGDNGTIVQILVPL